MSENYQFISTDSETLLAEFIASYESLKGTVLNPSDPERLLISWVASIYIQLSEKINYTGNQNIPSRAKAPNLDTLGETIFGLERRGITAAITTIRFYISEAQASAVLIPAGTRVSDSGRSVTFATNSDAYVPIGSTYVDVIATCITTKTVNEEEVNIGADGNGYVAGQISTLVDVYGFYSSCANITITDGGADVPTDSEYYELLRSYMDTWSTAGPMGAYIYLAKSVSPEIADAKAIQPVAAIAISPNAYSLSGSSHKFAFVGVNDPDLDSLVVYPHESATPAAYDTDYTYEYADNLLTITLLSTGALASATQVDVEIKDLLGGRVYIFLIMNDGNFASSTIKSLVLAKCNEDDARPLTDSVSCHDPEVVEYELDITYYIQTDSELSASEIESSVSAAIDEYQIWQRAKIGRDVNPSYLHQLLMQTGIKRAVISEPLFIELQDGREHTTPQVAILKTNVDDFTGDGETTQFTLTLTADHIDAVTIDGAETDDYIYASGTVTFDAPPPGGSEIVVAYPSTRIINGGYEDE